MRMKIWRTTTPAMNKCGNEGVELPMPPNSLTKPPSSLTPCGAVRVAQNAVGKSIVRIKFNDVVSD